MIAFTILTVQNIAERLSRVLVEVKKYTNAKEIQVVKQDDLMPEKQRKEKKGNQEPLESFKKKKSQFDKRIKRNILV